MAFLTQSQANCRTPSQSESELEGEPNIMNLYRNQVQPREDSNLLIAQPQDTATTSQLFRFQAFIDKCEVEKLHLTQKHQMEMEDMKQQMQHREEMRKMELEHMKRQLSSQEVAFHAKLERIQTAHVSELLDKEEELEQTHSYYKSWIEDFKRSYQEQFDAKEEENCQLREQITQKEQQILELKKTVQGLQKEGGELVELHKRPIWKKLTDQITGKDKKDQRTWQHFPQMNASHTQGGPKRRVFRTLPARI